SGPSGYADDTQYQHARERLVAVLRVALGQPGGERRLRAGGILEAQFGAHPPQPRPVVAVPVVDQQRGPRIGLEVALPLQPRRRLRLHPVDRDAHDVVVDGVDDRHGIDAPRRVHGAQDPVVVRRQPGPRLVLGELHGCDPTAMNPAVWVARHGRLRPDEPALADGERVHATWAAFAARTAAAAAGLRDG